MTVVATDRINGALKIKRSMKQDDPTSLQLLSKEEICNRLIYNDRGISIKRKKLNQFRFTNKIVFKSKIYEGTKKILQELNEEG